MKRWIWIISLCLMVLPITACGLFKPKETKSVAPQPPFTGTEVPVSQSVEKNKINVNPIEINNDGVTKQTDMGRTPFVKDDDPNQRFKRLEMSVQEIQDKLAKVSPKISRLMDIESELGQLTFQLEQFLNQKKQPPPPVLQPTIMAPVATVAPIMRGLETASPPIIQAISGINLRNIRIGPHSDKTRIVLETDGKVNYQTDFDDLLNILVVVFPKSEVGVDLKRSLNSIVGRSRTVQSITLNEDEQNIIALFDMGKNVARTKHFRAAPDKEYQYHRIVIDLFS